MASLARSPIGPDPVGQINAGQKLNAAFSVGSIIIMLATGAIMFFNAWFPDDIRTGARSCTTG